MHIYTSNLSSLKSFTSLTFALMTQTHSSGNHLFLIDDTIKGLRLSASSSDAIVPQLSSVAIRWYTELMLSNEHLQNIQHGIWFWKHCLATVLCAVKQTPECNHCHSSDRSIEQINKESRCLFVLLNLTACCSRVSLYREVNVYVRSTCGEFTTTNTYFMNVCVCLLAHAWMCMFQSFSDRTLLCERFYSIRFGMNICACVVQNVSAIFKNVRLLVKVHNSFDFSRNFIIRNSSIICRCSWKANEGFRREHQEKCGELASGSA